MVIAYPGEEWIIKLGHITRTNHAGNRKQAEEGALQQIVEDTKELLEKAKLLIPLLQKGAVCSGDCEPIVEEEPFKSQVVSYQLPDGKWFSIATSGFFGVKLVCKRKGE